MDDGSETPEENPLDEEEKETVWVGMAQQRDKEQDLQDIMHFLETFTPPKGQDTRARQRFLRQAAHYYRQGNRLYRQHSSGHNQRVLMTGGERRRILTELHDGNGH